MTALRKSAPKRTTTSKPASPRKKVVHPDRNYMEEAIKAMLESRSEGAGKKDPLVGTVLVSQSGTILGRAHRGKYGSGDHGEFTLLEKSNIKLRQNAVLYVTLEPCSQRGPGKTPCAQRIVESGIKHVVIGIQDPNPDIYGQGRKILSDAGIRVDDFETDLAGVITTLNREFIDEQERRAAQLASPLRSPDRHENLPLHEASTSDFSGDAINLYLNKTSKRFKVPSPALWEEFTRSGFVAEGKNKKDLKPTIAGMVLFGKEPHQFFPQARIKADHFAGPVDETASLERVLHQLDITGPLFQQVEAALEFFRTNVRKVPRLRGSQREVVLEYPEEVVRELVVNALVHRDYQAGPPIFFRIFRDEIEIRSPGLPVAPLTIDMFPDRVTSIPRNPRIAQAAFELNLMEGRGFGIKPMPERLKSHQLRAPEFLLQSGFFVVKLFGRERTPFSIRTDTQTLASLSPRQIQIIQLAENKRTIRSEDVVSSIGVSKETAAQDLRRLIELGIFEKTGTARATAYFLKMS